MREGIALALSALVAGTAAIAAYAGAAQRSVVGVFEGRTPCGAIVVEFSGFPAQGCEKIKMRLTLYREDARAEPTTYKFEGTRAKREGRVSVERGAPSNPAAVVYRLQYPEPGRFISLLRVDENILIFLDGALKPLVGDASWNYTLSRTDRVPGR